MALSLLFFGLIRYSILFVQIILSYLKFKMIVVCHSFFADIIFCVKTPTEIKNKTKLIEQSCLASMVALACNVRCLSLSYCMTVSKF